MDIEVIIRKTLVFAGLFAFVYIIFGGVAYLTQETFQQATKVNRWVALIPSVLIILFSIRAAERLLINATDRFLFQKKYDYRDLLKAFASEVLTVVDLKELMRTTAEKISVVMKLEGCEVLLAEDGDKISPVPMEIKEGSARVPILSQGRMVGTLTLGRKKSDQAYTQEDFDILQPLANALGIAITNARLFEELARTHAEMAQKEKMATIGALAAGMAHEIRNPITTIRNFADFMPDKYNDEEFLRNFRRIIPSEIDRVERIARSLLEFSPSRTEGQAERVKVTDFIDLAAVLLTPQYRSSDIRIEKIGSPAASITTAKKSSIQDGFFNIIKYVFAEAAKGSALVVEASELNDGTAISMRSSGLVVSDAVMKDVFEPTSSGYRARRGFGFDLFVAKQVLENAGATFAIEQKQDGSVFRVTFPSASARAS